jgi:hypothetical protein
VTEEKSDPPGAVSDQNGEEQQSGMRDDQQHPEPRSREQDEADDRGGDGEGGGSSGAAGEGSQSTGDPDSAG